MLSTNPNKEFIRDVSLYPMYFSLYNGTTNAVSTAALGDRLQILKFLGLNKAALTGEVRVQHSRPGTVSHVQFDSSQAAQITFTAPTVDTVANFMLDLELMSGQTGEFHEGWDHYRRRVQLEVLIPANASRAQVVDALYQGLVDYDFTNELAVKRFSYTYDNTTTPGVSVLDVYSLDPRVKISFSTYSAVFSADALANPVKKLTPAVITEAYEGMGTLLTLLPERLLTDVTNMPYEGLDTQVPRPGESFTCVSFRQIIQRPDIGGDAVVNETTAEDTYYQYYVQETTGNKQWLTDLLTFLAGAGSPSSSVTKTYILADGTTAASATAFLAVWP